MKRERATARRMKSKPKASALNFLVLIKYLSANKPERLSNGDKWARECLHYVTSASYSGRSLSFGAIIRLDMILTAIVMQIASFHWKICQQCKFDANRDANLLNIKTFSDVRRFPSAWWPRNTDRWASSAGACWSTRCSASWCPSRHMWVIELLS